MDFLQWISEAFKAIANAILNILPSSPIVFLEKNKTVSLYLSYVNYFIPVYLWISVLQAWLVSIGIYYCYKIVLRWIKME